MTVFLTARPPTFYGGTTSRKGRPGRDAELHDRDAVHLTHAWVISATRSWAQESACSSVR